MKDASVDSTSSSNNDTKAGTKKKGKKEISQHVKSSEVHERLIAHIIATKIEEETVTEESMEIPELDKYGRKTDSKDKRGHTEAGRTIAIHSVVVSPDWQHQSIGSTLLKDYIQRLTTQHTADRMVLLAHDKLTPFYENLSFLSLGESAVKFGGGGWTDMMRELEETDDY